METKELEDLQAKVGGKYKLVTLYQKRLRELQRGLPRLADGTTPDPWDTVYSEVMSGKVDLVMGEEADQMRKEIALREAEEGGDDKDKGDKGKREHREPREPKQLEAKGE